MAHQEQIDFCLKVKSMHPSFFCAGKVLDIGSLDINGNNRYLFENAIASGDIEYTGIDIGPGKNVDIVYKAHEFQGPDNYYDVIISTECFEHDMFYAESLKNIVRMLGHARLLLFTCATTGRAEHGTKKTSPECAPLLSGNWADYYKNLTEQDIRNAIDIDKIFYSYQYGFEVNEKSHDLYFYGIKQ